MANMDFWKGAAAGFAFALAIGVSGYLGYEAGQDPSVLSDRAHVEKLQFLEHVIDRYYMGEKDEEALAEGLYTGLVYGLGDPYSRYYTAEDYGEEDKENEGGYVGLGIELSRNMDGYAQISGVYEGSPAWKEGLLEGDLILGVNDEDVTELELSEIVEKIRESGDEITIQILRDEEEYLEYTLSLGQVTFFSVSQQMLGSSTGYIEITEFTNATPAQFSDALEAVRAAGADRLIIDLRGNPGGVMEAACDTLRLILPKGLIVYTQDKDGGREEEYCDGETPLELPLVVLVDRDSASAAEIFAGAVKDYGIGTLVGTKTFGKGIVQTIRQLTDGSAIKLTTAKYFTPNGNDIHGEGIEPDVKVEYDPDSRQETDDGVEMDNQLAAALEVLEEKETEGDHAA